MTPLCFVDTEATGLSRRRKTWEVAMVRRDDQGERSAEFFVDVDLADAELIGLNIGRFFERHPLGRRIAGQSVPNMLLREQVKTREEAAYIIARMTHGAHVVGAIPSFETEHDLADMLYEAGLLPTWHYHIVDVEAMTVGYLKARGHQIDLPWKSDELTALLGLDPVPEEERHTAMGDVRWAARIYDKIMATDADARAESERIARELDLAEMPAAAGIARKAGARA